VSLPAGADEDSIEATLWQRHPHCLCGDFGTEADRAARSGTARRL